VKAREREREREIEREREFITRGSNYSYKPCLFFIINFNHHIKRQNVNFWNVQYALIVLCYDNLQVLEQPVTGQGLSAQTHPSKQIQERTNFYGSTWSH
jgi:hypothetical protein